PSRAYVEVAPGSRRLRVSRRQDQSRQRGVARALAKSREVDGFYPRLLSLGNEAVDLPAAQLLAGVACRRGVETDDPGSVKPPGAAHDRDGPWGGFGKHRGCLLQRRDQGLLCFGQRPISPDLDMVPAGIGHSWGRLTGL